MSYNLGLISLGCPKNLVDSEIMLGAFKEKGFVPVEDLSQADAIIINTCAFVGDAKEEAIVSILEASRQKEEGQLKALVVTGCLAQRYREEIISEIPEVDLVSERKYYPGGRANKGLSRWREFGKPYMV